VTDVDELAGYLDSQKRAGDTVTLDVLRDGQEMGGGDPGRVAELGTAERVELPPETLRCGLTTRPVGPSAAKGLSFDTHAPLR
jgi:hypothetical protein